MAPTNKQGMPLARLIRSLRQVVQEPAPCPPVYPLLESLSGLEQAPPTVFSWLAKALVPRSFHEGEILVQQGEQGDSAFLLAAGRVGVLRLVRERRAEPLAVLEPSAVVGTVRLVRPGHRTATCVGRGDGWVYVMEREAYLALPQPARSAWKVFLLANLAPQLVSASTLLAGLTSWVEGGPAEPADDAQETAWDEDEVRQTA